MDIFEGLREYFKPKEKGTSVTVQFLPNRALEKMVDKSPEGKVDIEMQTWQETSGNIPISNHGAGPCLIIYVLDRVSGKVLSGHFPEVQKDRQDMFDKRGLQRMEKNFPKIDVENTHIEIPKQEDVNRLSYLRKDKSYEQYVLMRERLQKIIQESGDGNVEVFLFGNNKGAYGVDAVEYAQKIVDSAVDQNSVALDLKQVGVLNRNLHDYRVVGQSNVDDTYYDPKKRVIYHSVR